RPQERPTDEDDEATRGHAEHRVQALRRQHARGGEGDAREDEDTERMRHRDGEPEADGLAARAPAAHEVRGHDGLAVTGRNGMHDAEPERDGKRDKYGD